LPSRVNNPLNRAGARRSAACWPVNSAQSIVLWAKT
jgi:hypothetical protein